MSPDSEVLEAWQQRLDRLREAYRADPSVSRQWWYLSLKIKVLQFLCAFYQHTRPLPLPPPPPPPRRRRPPRERRPPVFDWLRTPIFLTGRRRVIRPPSPFRPPRTRVSLHRKRQPRHGSDLRDLLARISEANEPLWEEFLDEES